MYHKAGLGKPGRSISSFPSKLISVTKEHPEKLKCRKISVLNADSAKFILGKISASSSVPSLKMHCF